MHPVCLLFGAWVMLAVPAAGQGWVTQSSIPLPESGQNLIRLAVGAGLPRYYLLDGISMELLALDAGGAVQERYGGWGSGALRLDLPEDLYATENSVFVLDIGENRILRLDSRLNPVAVTSLPADYLPRAFVRDTRQRYWMAYEGRAGLYLYDDDGRLLDVVGDEASGEAVVLHPALLAGSPAGVAVWDPVAADIALFHLSGRLDRRIPFPDQAAVLDMEWRGDNLILALETGLVQIVIDGGSPVPVLESAGIIDLAGVPVPGGRGGQGLRLYGLDPTRGVIRVFEPTH